MVSFQNLVEVQITEIINFSYSFQCFSQDVCEQIHYEVNRKIKNIQFDIKMYFFDGKSCHERTKGPFCQWCHYKSFFGCEHYYFHFRICVHGFSYFRRSDQRSHSTWIKTRHEINTHWKQVQLSFFNRPLLSIRYLLRYKQDLTLRKCLALLESCRNIKR